MALDMLYASQGGVCTVINGSCCTYIDQDKRTSTGIENIWNHVKAVHEVTKDDTSWGFKELWDKITFWLPNFAWVKQLFIFVIKLLDF